MLGILILVQTVTASTMTFTESAVPEEIIIGVTVDNDYYTAVVQDDKLVKLELDGQEETEYQISTTQDQLVDFATKQVGMSKIEKIRYVTEEFKVSMSLMMRVAGDYIKGAFN